MVFFSSLGFLSWFGCGFLVLFSSLSFLSYWSFGRGSFVVFFSGLSFLSGFGGGFVMLVGSLSLLSYWRFFAVLFSGLSFLLWGFFGGFLVFFLVVSRFSWQLRSALILFSSLNPQIVFFGKPGWAVEEIIEESIRRFRE